MRAPFEGTFLATGTFLIGLFLSIVLFLQMHAHEQQLEDLNFDRRASTQVMTLQNGVKDATRALEALAQTFYAFGPLTEDQFRIFSQPLLEHDLFIQHFSYHQFVSAADRPAFEATMRKHYPTFTLSNSVDRKRVPALESNIYRVITYVSQTLGNEEFTKLDLYRSTPQQDDALRRAIDTGLPSATGLFQPLQQTGSQLAFAVIAPVYAKGKEIDTVASRRHTVIGCVVVMFRVADLVEQLLKSADLWTVSADMSIYASTTPGASELAFRTENSGSTKGSRIFPEWLLHDLPSPFSRTVDVAGKQWKIIITARPVPFYDYHLGSLCGLVGGILFSLLAARNMRQVSLRSRHVQMLVDERTAALNIANACLTEDITRRKHTEEALRHTEHVLTNAQNVSHLGSWEFDVRTGTLQCSDEFFRICGLTPQSIKPTLEFMLSITHPEDLEAAKNAIAMALEACSGYRIEKRIVRPDGSIRYVTSQGELTYDRNHQFPRVIGSFLDVTEHKEIQIALRESQDKLRALAAHLVRIKEEERKRIAREIHDELGSLLTGIKAHISIALSPAKQSCARPELLLAEASSLIDSATETVRRIITDLRPSVLDDLGIWTALEWYANQIEKRTGLLCTCSIPENVGMDLDSERSITLFRIVQESLNNVVKHAGASRVAIRVQYQESRVVVEIEDDGKGIDIRRLHKYQSWGIVGMDERVRYFGGSLSITGMPGLGTKVVLDLPLKDNLEDNNDQRQDQGTVSGRPCGRTERLAVAVDGGT